MALGQSLGTCPASQVLPPTLPPVWAALPGVVLEARALLIVKNEKTS